MIRFLFQLFLFLDRLLSNCRCSQKEVTFSFTRDLWIRKTIRRRQTTPVAAYKIVRPPIVSTAQVSCILRLGSVCIVSAKNSAHLWQAIFQKQTKKKKEIMYFFTTHLLLIIVLSDVVNAVWWHDSCNATVFPSFGGRGRLAWWFLPLRSYFLTVQLG